MDEDTRPIETTTPSEPSIGASVTPIAAQPEAPMVGQQPAPTHAVAPPPGAATVGGSSRTRWVIGIGIAVVAVAVAIGAFLVLGKPATPSALSYIPGDAAFVGEIRLDLPGDQMQHLGNLLAKFPGFADQSTLNDKIDEALSRLVATSGARGLDYKTDIKPWLNGPAFIGVLAPAGGTGMMTGAGTGEAVISATTNGAVACATTFKGQTVAHEPYKGLDLVTSADGHSACVVDGRQALLGDPATVKKALDAKAAGTGMDRNARYSAARTALGLDRLATVFVSPAAISSMMPAASAMPGMPDLATLTGPLPDWVIVGVRSEDDALVVDTVSAPVTAPATGPSLLPLPPAHASVVAPMVPKDTLMFVEDQGTGVALQNLLARLRAVPQLSQTLQMLDGLGGASKLVGWIDDAAVAVSVHGTTPDVAILLVARDEASATSTVTSLGTILTLAGQAEGIRVAQSTIGGVAVTTVTIADLSKLVPAGSTQGMTIAPTGPVSFSIAAHGKVVLLTSGEAAMTAILNVAAGSSLADDATFKLAGQHGLVNSRMTIYVAAGATIDLAQGLLPAEALAKFKTDVLPYVDPLTSVSVSVNEDATGNRSRLVIAATKP